MPVIDWDAPSDEAFVEQAFLEVLGRPVDPVGRRHFREQLARGVTRQDLVAALEQSEEHRHKSGPRELFDLRAAHPERFATVPRLDGTGEMVVFEAEGDEELAWMEAQILANGYYEAPGVWTFQVDVDKKVMAEVARQLEPASVLELGCSSGAVLHVLDSWGVEVTGVEVSRLAVEHAPATVAGRIHVGDLPSLPPGPPVDVGVALDVLEHLRPDAVPAAVAELSGRAPNGLVLVNVPAFGPDAVFGEAFPMDTQSWVDDAAAGRWFRHLPVDPLGYPTHGHLVWASPQWWQDRFAEAGLRRLPVVERALHRVYDEHWIECTPARRSLFVLTPEEGGLDERSARGLAHRIGRHGSAILESLGEVRPDRLRPLRQVWQVLAPQPVRAALSRIRHRVARRPIP